MPEKTEPGGWAGAPGKEKKTIAHTNITHSRNGCQVVKIALPYIAAIVTSTRFTDKKSRFLDKLIVLAEGGRRDFQI